MKEINYWDRFLVTGKVDDFLSYKKEEHRIKDGIIERDARENKSGGYSYAGIYRDYGHDLKS
ncbi:MAG: hypothetical protein NC314_06680 [Roseburia sp.]|nr:hypothetical protein [Ruminococcus sp.]MCM1155865.1 hypothetical protein [Roseburia sp.]MCM1242511.1 hypothetical protein [Roseburia sp.]